MTKEDEQWELMHVLKGIHRTPGVCSTRCADPVCQAGCLRQLAKTNFRADIMHGVTIARNSGDPRFPFVVPANYKGDCVGPYTCYDATCQVVGCMEKPGYHFRDLIKLAHDNKIIEALKK